MASRVAKPTTRWLGRSDKALIAVALVAAIASSFIFGSAFRRLFTDSQNRQALLAAGFWLAIVVPWSWGLTACSIVAFRLPVRRSAPRLGLLMAISFPGCLYLAAAVRHVSSAKGIEKYIPDVVSLIESQSKQHHPASQLLILLALVPVAASWGLLVNLPSVRASIHRRRLVDLALAANVIAVTFIAVSYSAVAAAGSEWPRAVGSIVVAVVMLVLGARIRVEAELVDDRLPPSLHRAVSIGAPVSMAIGAVTMIGVGFSQSAPMWLGAIGYLIAVLPLMAAVIFAYDYFVIGGTRGARSLLSAERDPHAVENQLRHAVGDNGLRIVFEGDDDWLVDVEGNPLDATSIPAGQLQWIEVGDRRVAAVIWSRGDDGGPARSSALLPLAALALDRARTQAQLQAQLNEARALNQRVIDAESSVRRSVERDLHDGAQQMLLTAIGHARRAAHATTDPAARAECLRAAEAGTNALDMIRSIARGIYPMPLVSGGLGAAVDELRRTVPIPVVSHITDERFERRTEEAAYFIISEALTNCVKHSGATSASVTVRREGENLRVSISDAGRGGADPNGHGLRGLRDRAVGANGRLLVTSPPGRGTQITARLPIPAAPVIVLPTAHLHLVSAAADE